MLKYAFVLLFLCCSVMSYPHSYEPGNEEPELLENEQARGRTLNGETFGNVISHLNQATKQTLNEQTQSISKTIHSIVGASGLALQAGIDTAQTGLDIILVIPKFGKNVLNQVGHVPN